MSGIATEPKCRICTQKVFIKKIKNNITHSPNTFSRQKSTQQININISVCSTENKTQDRRKCWEPECQDPRTETKVDRIVRIQTPSPKYNTYTKECRAQRTIPELLHSHKDKKGQYNTGSCH